MSNLPDSFSSPLFYARFGDEAWDAEQEEFGFLQSADDASADELRAAILNVINLRKRQTYYIDADGPVPGYDEKHFIDALTDLLPPDQATLECRA